MNNGIIKGNGNSRYLKTVSDALTLYPTHESLIEALASGTFPIDLNGINADGWTQIGTALNKANLLSDETAALYGFGTDATVNDVFALLSSGVAIDLLWENADPASSFPAQTISMDLSGYEAFIVDISTSKTSATRSTTWISKNDTIRATINQADWSYTRVVTPNDAGITFEGAYYARYYNSLTGAGDQYATPRKIYGIRRVSL